MYTQAVEGPSSCAKHRYMFGLLSLIQEPHFEFFNFPRFTLDVEMRPHIYLKLASVSVLTTSTRAVNQLGDIVCRYTSITDADVNY